MLGTVVEKPREKRNQTPQAMPTPALRHGGTVTERAAHRGAVGQKADFPAPAFVVVKDLSL